MTIGELFNISTLDPLLPTFLIATLYLCVLSIITYYSLAVAWEVFWASQWSPSPLDPSTEVVLTLTTHRSHYSHVYLTHAQFRITCDFDQFCLAYNSIPVAPRNTTIEDQYSVLKGSWDFYQGAKISGSTQTVDDHGLTCGSAAILETAFHSHLFPNTMCGVVSHLLVYPQLASIRSIMLRLTLEKKLTHSIGTITTYFNCQPPKMLVEAVAGLPVLHIINKPTTAPTVLKRSVINLRLPVSKLNIHLERATKDFGSMLPGQFKNPDIW